MRTLGIDHGERRVGIALSDDEGMIAQPHDTWERKDVDALLDRLAAFVRDQDVGAVVVGLPLSLEGREGASARRARRFAERLGERIGFEVVLWDERLTTAAAERSLSKAGVSARDQKSVVDKVAAALFLQSYLDSRRGESAWPTSDVAAPPADRSGKRRGRRGGRSRGR